jgi:hypothetical protein
MLAIALDTGTAVQAGLFGGLNMVLAPVSPLRSFYKQSSEWCFPLNLLRWDLNPYSNLIIRLFCWELGSSENGTGLLLILRKKYVELYCFT